MTRIILDTTFYIGLYMQGNLYTKLKDYFKSNQSNYRLYWSDALFNEVKYQLFTNTKVAEKVFNHSQEKATDFLENLKIIHTEITPLDTLDNVQGLKDRQDYHLCELAKQIEAHYLLTNDKALLILENFGQTKITRYSLFLDNNYL